MCLLNLEKNTVVNDSKGGEPRPRPTPSPQRLSQSTSTTPKISFGPSIVYYHTITKLPTTMAKNNIPAYVLGVGLTKFIKPRKERAYPEMGYEAGVKAMLDAQINYDDVETGVACYCYGDTTSGQRIFYQFGMSS